MHVLRPTVCLRLPHLVHYLLMAPLVLSDQPYCTAIGRIATLMAALSTEQINADTALRAMTVCHCVLPLGLLSGTTAGPDAASSSATARPCRDTAGGLLGILFRRKSAAASWRSLLVALHTGGELECRGVEGARTLKSRVFGVPKAVWRQEAQGFVCADHSCLADMVVESGAADVAKSAGLPTCC